MPVPSQADAVGGTLSAQWHAKSLADLFPDFFTLISVAAQTTLTALTPLEAAIDIITLAQSAATLLPSVPNVAIAILNAAIDIALATVINQINNIRNSGQAFAILPPTPGGLKGASRVIRQALLNVRDNQRPAFQPGATVAGWAIIAAADIGTIQKIISAIQALFASSDAMVAKSNTVRATVSLNFPDPFSAQKVSGRPAPQNTPQWLQVRIVDLIPGADDAFDNLISALNSLKTPIDQMISLPIIDYIAFINKILGRIKAILAFVVALIVLLQSLFLDIPIKVLEFDAQFGSTQDIADSISPWFSTAQPILSDVPDNLYTCGVFSVIGSEDPFSPALQMDTLRLLFLP